MAARPPAPPPPPPIAWTPPGGGHPFAGGAWPRTVAPQRARRAIQQIRSSIGLYRWVPALAVVSGLLVAALAVSTGGPVITSALGGSFTLPSFNNSSANRTAPAPAGLTALSAASGVVALASLVLLILAWVEWRGGLKELRAAEGTPWSPREPVETAHRYYVGTIVAFLLALVAGFVVAGVVFGLLLQVEAHALFGSRISIAGVQTELRDTLVGGIVASAALNAAMYFCAGTSLGAVLRTLGSPAQAARLDRGRAWMVAGALFAVAGLLAALNPWLLFLAAVGPALIVLGLEEARGVYGEWLNEHPPDQGPLAPPFPPGLGPPLPPPPPGGLP